jgi:hypothetical protein
MNNTYGANWELSKLPLAPLDIRVTTKGSSTVLRWAHCCCVTVLFSHAVVIDWVCMCCGLFSS